MAISRRTCSIVVQFMLIIIICAAISGIVGGVTSKVSQWKASAVVQPAVNATIADTPTSMRMAGRMFVA
jgi:hypothetical protein